jgi:transcriptional regulator with XRE-family HTH domain
MESQTLMPFELPSTLWSRDEMRRALAARDIAAVFALAQQYAGITQGRIGTATGLSQGRVNEIINGRRRVTGIDVLERIAAGLSMPDRARLALGLAPAAAGIPAQIGRAGIASAYASQSSAAAEIRDAAWQAVEVDLLAVRALGLVALNDSLLREALAAPREETVNLRVLLLDPDCAAAVTRAEEIGESPASFAAGIRMALARIEELATLPHLDITAAVYTTLPVWRIIALDSTIYLSVFDHAVEGHQSSLYKITGPENLLHAGFSRQFADQWGTARRVL